MALYGNLWNFTAIVDSRDSVNGSDIVDYSASVDSRDIDDNKYKISDKAFQLLLGH